MKLAGCLLLLLTLPAHAWPLGELGEVQFERVADAVYVIHGPLSAPNAANQGFMNNPGMIVSAHGVILIDPGSSTRIGRHILAEVAKITPKPVLAVFNTHIHGDHWLANHAIQTAYPNVALYAHPNMIAQAAQAGATWVQDMLAWTKGASAGTHVVGPTIAVHSGTELNIDGQQFRIHAVVPAHTDTDIMLQHLNSQTLFLGDNGFHQRLGQFDHSADILGNIRALTQVAQLPIQVYVPGHGQSGRKAQVLTPYLSYLSRLQRVVQSGYDDGLMDYEIKSKAWASFQAYHDWSGFAFNFGKHINRLYLAIELRDE